MQFREGARHSTLCIRGILEMAIRSGGPGSRVLINDAMCPCVSPYNCCSRPAQARVAPRMFIRKLKQLKYKTLL